MPDLFGNADPMVRKSPAEQYVTNCDLISNLEYKGKPIRRTKLEDGTEAWVVIDVIGAVTGSKNPRHYWVVTKKRMIEEGWDEVTNCYPMSIPDSLGRPQITQVMTIPQILRLLQSLPSKKAEPFRIFMAEAGYTLIQEASNPDLAIKRGYENYRKKGMSPEMAMKRAKLVLHRNVLTDQWKSHGHLRQDYGGDTVISALISKNNPYGYEENAVEVDKGSKVGAEVLKMVRGVLEA